MSTASVNSINMMPRKCLFSRYKIGCIRNNDYCTIFCDDQRERKSIVSDGGIGANKRRGSIVTLLK